MLAGGAGGDVGRGARVPGGDVVVVSGGDVDGVVVVPGGDVDGVDVVAVFGVDVDVVVFGGDVDGVVVVADIDVVVVLVVVVSGVDMVVVVVSGGGGAVDSVGAVVSAGEPIGEPSSAAITCPLPIAVMRPRAAVTMTRLIARHPVDRRTRRAGGGQAALRSTSIRW